MGGIQVYLNEAEAWEQKLKHDAWKAEQPDFLMEKMSNREIVKAFSDEECISLNGQIIFHAGRNTMKQIKGELYEKVPNPKNINDRFKEIIPWED